MSSYFDLIPVELLAEIVKYLPNYTLCSFYSSNISSPITLWTYLMQGNFSSEYEFIHRKYPEESLMSVYKILLKTKNYLLWNKYIHAERINYVPLIDYYTEMILLSDIYLRDIIDYYTFFLNIFMLRNLSLDLIIL